MSGLNERAKQAIALLAGDDLDGEQVAEARRSIESCPHCRRHWVRLRGCLDVLERAGKATEPPLASSLWPAIESRLRPAMVVRRPEKFNGWVPALSMAAACIALLVAGQMDGVLPQDASPEYAPVTVRRASAAMWRPRLDPLNRSESMGRYSAGVVEPFGPSPFGPSPEEVRQLLEIGRDRFGGPYSWTSPEFDR